MKAFIAVFAICAVAGFCSADDDYGRNYKPSYNGKTPEGYFQYVNVPGEHEYEFGYNRGNPSHYTSRFEQAKDWRFRTRAKWADAHGGYGEHYWEYNHGHHHEPAYHAPSYSAPAYPAPSYQAGGYSEPEPAYAPAASEDVPEYATSN
ncbi:uncharacterized protein LOC136039587 [Artemia franciscana]|uniref:Cuticle protein n=1 Tax=Artemia franciscana TaxID=6661 RepID=A0AA88I4P4_ARTSF|nr:hypothetical protein QYM36_010090 [Artemia franciscana]